MRERVAKAKAFIAVKNYNAAIYELENIRRESADPTVNSVINVLLMNSYLEQGDYKRAQDFLAELAKSTKSTAKEHYLTVAAQVIKGAKNQLERYRALGLSVSDRNLPPAAADDIEKMRVTLEAVVEQSKVLSKDKAQTANAMALLEEATNARSNLAKDNFDATRWKNEAADARELLASSRSVVINAVNDLPTETQNQNVAANTTPLETKSAQIIPVDAKTNPTNGPTPIETVAKKIEAPVVTETPKQETKTDKKTDADTAEKNVRTRRVESQLAENKINVADTNPLDVGSLVEYATRKVDAVYPQQARSFRQSGIVKVELMIDENGLVAAVQKLSGPKLLQGAAEDAVKKWRFKPFMRDGQPVKATGFVSFNFNL